MLRLAGSAVRIGSAMQGACAQAHIVNRTSKAVQRGTADFQLFIVAELIRRSQWRRIPAEETAKASAGLLKIFLSNGECRRSKSAWAFTSSFSFERCNHRL